MLSWTEKSNLLNKSCFYRNSVRCQKLQQIVWSAVFRSWHRRTIVLLLVYCSDDNTLFEVAHKFAVRACQVATVVMKTTQLILSQLKKYYIISKCCKLVKLCHINQSGFFDKQCITVVHNRKNDYSVALGCVYPGPFNNGSIAPYSN